MDKKVLVAYATKYGATKEIAEKIGEALKQEGQKVDTCDVKTVKNPAEYGAFIIGSAMYIGGWRKEAANFLKANEKALAEHPVWLFSSGPGGEGDPVQLVKGWRFPKALQPVADRIKPRDIAVFHGNVNAKKMNFIEKWMMKNVKSPIGDFRKWDMINKWTKGIAETLKKQK
jgi:menaquinone-dependent protoporphyrinogen oxidase